MDTTTPGARNAVRIQTGLLAEAERRLIAQICPRLPAWITPDRLTALGLAGSVLTFLGYLGAGHHPGWLFLASFGYVVNWFGDSFDGSLARHRRIERPKYGYFIDHSVDALCYLLIAFGLGLSGYVRFDVASIALVGYMLLSIHVYLVSYVNDEFRLTFLNGGPTELRLILIALGTAMWAIGPAPLTIGGFVGSWWDLLVGATAIVFFALYVAMTAKVAAALRREDTRAPRAPR